MSDNQETNRINERLDDDDDDDDKVVDIVGNLDTYAYIVQQQPSVVEIIDGRLAEMVKLLDERLPVFKVDSNNDEIKIRLEDVFATTEDPCLFCVSIDVHGNSDLCEECNVLLGTWIKEDGCPSHFELHPKFK